GSRHRGTQVGSPDTDVHDLLDGSPGDTQPSTTAQVAAEVSHPTEDFVDVCGDVHPVDLEILVHRDAQRGVQGGTVLGGVDRSPGHHRVTVLRQPHRLAQLNQQFHDSSIGEVFRQVDVQRPGLDG